ncbi:MAG: Ig-like domain-containing protein [Candidatus Pacebacteria bacterium]|nr:Ig-like domain-containing protein [Candidatus Paceibacterota bacterium]
METVRWRYTLSAIIAAALSFVLPLSAFASFNGILPLTTSGSMPAPQAGPAITMSSHDLTAGQTAIVTFTFPVAPLDFVASDTSATNGTLSNFASTTNPDVYTETFTPSTNTNAATNVISVKGRAIGTTYKDPSFNEPYAITFDGTNMWVANANNNDIDKITSDGTITAYSGFDGPSGIAFDGTNLWVVNYGGPDGSGSGNGHTVDEVSPSGTIIASTTVAQAPAAIAFDGTNMWVASYVDGTSPGIVTEIASTSAILLTATTSPGPNAIAFDGTNMWTANLGSNNNADGDSVTKISPTGTSTTYVGTGHGTAGIASDGTNMWTANYGSFTYAGPNYTDFEFDNNGNSVSKITPSGTITTYTGTGAEPSGIAFDGTNMWVTDYDPFNTQNGSVSVVAPDGTMVTYTGLGYNPVGIAYDGTSMWVANDNNNGIPGGDSVTKITGLISPATSANYVVATAPQTNTGGGTSSGGSITSQVANLIAMGNTQAAQALEAQWPNLFPSAAASITTASTTFSIVAPSITEVTSSATGSSTALTSGTVFTRYLERGMTGSEVQELQQYLNSHGFPIAATGPGSAGQETTYFGALTFNVLVKFQEAHAAAILAPFHLTSGTGILGPSTIAFITSH